MADNIFQCSFAINNSTDLVVSIGGLQPVAAGTTIDDLVNNNPSFWIEPNADGINRLCTTKNDTEPLEGRFTPASAPTYTVQATPFIQINYSTSTGHPVYRPI